MTESVTQQILHPEATVWFICHAETLEDDGGRARIDHRLSPLGIKQAEKLGENLHTCRVVFNHVVCSAAEAARQTADIAGACFFPEGTHGTSGNEGSCTARRSFRTTRRSRSSPKKRICLMRAIGELPVAPKSSIGSWTRARRSFARYPKSVQD